MFKQRHYWSMELGNIVCLGISTVQFRSNANRYGLPRAQPQSCANLQRHRWCPVMQLDATQWSQALSFTLFPTVKNLAGLQSLLHGVRTDPRPCASRELPSPRCFWSLPAQTSSDAPNLL